ncbi:MAG: hypothetical protein HRT72_03525 [Flavobacteriales bacterium]|nr:hypothetical protein [Flavobacteriales bacterium]
MSNKITYTERLILLSVIVLFVSYLIYSFAVVHTIDKRIHCKELVREMINIPNVSGAIDSLEKVLVIKEKQIIDDFKYANTKIVGLKMEVDTLMTAYLDVDHRFVRNTDIGYYHALLNTYSLSVSAPEEIILNLVEDFEKGITTAKISSISLERVKSLVVDEKLFRLKIVFQQVSTVFREEGA